MLGSFIYSKDIHRASPKVKQVGRCLALSRFLLGGWKQGLRRHLLRQLLHRLGPITGATPKPRSPLKLQNRAQGTGSHFRKEWEKGTDRRKTVDETFPRETPNLGLRSFIPSPGRLGPAARRPLGRRHAEAAWGPRRRAPSRDQASSCGPTPIP